VDDFTKRILELYQETDLSRPKIAKELGVSKAVVTGRLDRLFRRLPELKVRPGQKPSKTLSGELSFQDDLNSAMSEEEFLEPFDWQGRLDEGLHFLVPGSKYAVIRDDDFRRCLNIPKDKWIRLKRRESNKSYQLSIGASIYWCQPESKSRLKSKIELAEEVL
jgi:hypothetical protein